jgi:putative membrane protein
MDVVARILIGVVALIHLYIVVLEMALWTAPRTLKTFGMTAEFAASTKVLAANQGLYNGFLAAGLIWSLFHPDPGVAHQLQLFFLGAVLIAGIYGAATASRTILLVQALPAALALVAVLLA